MNRVMLMGGAVIGTQLDRLLVQPFCAGPVPLVLRFDASKRNERPDEASVELQRLFGGSPGARIRILARKDAEGRHHVVSIRQPGPRHRVAWIAFNRLLEVPQALP